MRAWAAGEDGVWVERARAGTESPCRGNAEVAKVNTPIIVVERGAYLDVLVEVKGDVGALFFGVSDKLMLGSGGHA